MAVAKRRSNPVVELIAGGTAGMCEAFTCHPLDTIKVRMQLNKKAGTGDQVAKVVRRGFIGTGVDIVKKETPLGLYKGLGAVVGGITPKMAIRFSTYEFYKRKLAPADGSAISSTRTFIAGVGAGITEAVVIVNPTDVIKIRLQSQSHSMTDAIDAPRYRNTWHCLTSVIKEEGVSALYRGVVLTAARQATNQGVNFTAYSAFKKRLEDAQPELKNLPSWQTSIIGLISGAMGPLSNAPLDTVKTRMQRERGLSTESGLGRFTRIFTQLVREEGVHALYRGITPRIMRVAPGQAVTFTVYEYVRNMLDGTKVFQKKIF
ncbi:succinate/fumarate mitochondrial transporter [Trichomonascus vanleenenianus]|uniref:Sfc1p n=1 Tax=Trichomonascus vanleenenianus TaxID=2268995 RepID=UPI003ECB6D0C